MNTTRHLRLICGWHAVGIKPRTIDLFTLTITSGIIFLDLFSALIFFQYGLPFPHVPNYILLPHAQIKILEVLSTCDLMH